jgi:hypothetical protein
MLHRPHAIFAECDDAPGILQKNLARFGYRDATTGAIKQPHTELLFQEFDLLREGGLRDVQFLRGPSEAQFVRYGYKIT